MNVDIGRWSGRVALVTGASTGIGESICRELVRQGMIVVGCARNVEKIREIAKEEEKLAEKELKEGEKPKSGKLHAIKCDLAVESEILAMHEEIKSKFGRLDVCINNAVSCIDSSLLTGKPEDWMTMLQVNVMGLCINTKEAIKLMRSEGLKEAQIIHMSSMDGHRIPPLRKLKSDVPLPWFHVYFGTKFMIRALAEGLRQELKENHVNIRVSTISPGPVETESYARTTTPENAKAFFNNHKCLEAKDVAEAVKYILSTPQHVNVNDIVVAPVEYNM